MKQMIFGGLLRGAEIFVRINDPDIIRIMYGGSTHTREIPRIPLRHLMSGVRSG